MAQAGNGTAGQAARLILLLATLLGLTAMHTLGHAGPHALGEHRQPMSADYAALPITVAAVMACAGDGGSDMLTGPGHLPGGMSDWAVCLAILVGFAVIVLAAMLYARRQNGRTTTGRGQARRVVPRGPPPRRQSLTLATVSVLRT